MSYAQWQEEQDAWFSRADRFEGYDRGDAIGKFDPIDYLSPEELAEAEAWSEFFKDFVGPSPKPAPVEFDDIPF